MRLTLGICLDLDTSTIYFENWLRLEKPQCMLENDFFSEKSPRKINEEI